MIKRFTEIKQNGSETQTIPIGTSAEYITLSDGSILQEALGDIDLAEDGSIKEQIQDIKQITNSLDSTYAPIDGPNLIGPVSIDGTLSASAWDGNLPINGQLIIQQSNNVDRNLKIGISSARAVFTPGSDITGILFKGFENNSSQNLISILNSSVSVSADVFANNLPNCIRITDRSGLISFMNTNYTQSEKIHLLRISGQLTYALVTGTQYNTSSTSSYENIDGVGFARVWGQADNQHMLFYFFRGNSGRSGVFQTYINYTGTASSLKIVTYTLVPTTTSATVNTTMNISPI